MRPPRYGFSIDDEGNCIMGDPDHPNMKIKTDGTVEINGVEVVSSAGILAASHALLGSASVSGNLSAQTLVVDQEIFPTDLMYAALADNTTLAEAHVGKKLGITVDGKVLTLPATAAGMTFWIVNRGSADGAVEIKISPGADDKIMGCGLTSADNKDLINTKATAKVGDYVKLVGDGASGWYVTEMKGTWARE
jgi:hypothetical protein